VSFASQISKIWCVCVCVFSLPPWGVFIGPWGSSTNLEKLVWRQVVAGWPSHVASQPGGAASTNFLHCLNLLLIMWAHVLEVTGQTGIKHGRPADPWAFQLGFWPTQSMCQIHPRGDDDFVLWSTLLCHPLKCSNLVPKFPKSNKN
jgi:hypothetical protein